MIQWRALTGLTGTSLANLSIAAMIATIFSGFQGIGCRLFMDDSPMVAVAKRAAPQIFQLNAAPEPAIVPRPKGLSQKCGFHPALDRLPEITSPMVGDGSGGPGSACLLVNAMGRVDRVAHASLSTRRRIEPVMSDLRFHPALRDGRPVPAWVELRL